MGNEETGGTMGLRQGERWDAAEYAQLVGEVAAGLGVEDISRAHERTPGGIAAAAARMIPRAEHVRRRDAVAWLTGRLTDGDYDWEPVLRTRLAEDGIRYWSAADDTRLRQAWVDRTPMSELTVRFVAAELVLARRYLELSLAGSLADVADRLGATPGSQLDIRRKLAAVSAPAAQFLLVLWHADGPLHVSTHPSAEAAALLRDDLLDAATDTTGHPDGGVRWAIASREPGTGDGPTFSNHPAWHHPE